MSSILNKLIQREQGMPMYKPYYNVQKLLTKQRQDINILKLLNTPIIAAKCLPDFFISISRTQTVSLIYLKIELKFHINCINYFSTDISL